MGIGEIAVRVGYIWRPLFMGINPDQNWMTMMMRTSVKHLPHWGIQQQLCGSIHVLLLAVSTLMKQEEQCKEE